LAGHGHEEKVLSHTLEFAHRSPGPNDVFEGVTASDHVEGRVIEGQSLAVSLNQAHPVVSELVDDVAAHEL
jgi:hypothetical protein